METDSHETAIEKYHSSKQVASMFELSHATVNAWLRTGIIHGRKIGKNWRISESEIKRFLTMEVPA